MFNNYVIGSPSVWFKDNHILKIKTEPNLNKHKVFIAVGATVPSLSLRVQYMRSTGQNECTHLCCLNVKQLYRFSMCFRTCL